MLFLGDKQVKRQDLAAIFGVDADTRARIELNPSFEVANHRKWKDKANGNLSKAGAGMSFRTHFTAMNPSSGLEEVVRYATSFRKKQVGKELQDVYEPREVNFMGMKREFRNDLDLAFFYYIHPDNAASPIREKKNITTKPRIDYVDSKKRAAVKTAGLNRLAEAMRVATDMTDNEIVVIAKGLGKFKNLTKMKADEVRADVLEYASKYPADFLTKSADTLVVLKGKIHNLIDNGYIALNTIGNVRRWTFENGVNKGGVILDIHNKTVDAREALVTQMLGNLNDYYNIIHAMNDSINASSQARKHLESIEEKPVKNDVPEPVAVGADLPDHLREVNNELPPPIVQDPAEAAEVTMPTTHPEAMAFITARRKDGKKAAPKMASDMLAAIKDGTVNSVTYKAWMKNNLNI